MIIPTQFLLISPMYLLINVDVAVVFFYTYLLRQPSDRYVEDLQA